MMNGKSSTSSILAPMGLHGEDAPKRESLELEAAHAVVKKIGTQGS